MTALACLAGFILLFLSFSRISRPHEKKQVTISITGAAASSVLMSPGHSLLSGVNRQAMIISSGCGGKGTCGQCIVKIKDYDHPLSSQEALTLNDSEIKQGYRLACQARVHHDLIITLPTSKAKSAID